MVTPTSRFTQAKLIRNSLRKVFPFLNQRMSIAWYYESSLAFTRLRELHLAAVLPPHASFRPLVVSPLLKVEYAQRAYLRSLVATLAHFVALQEAQRVAWFDSLLDYLEKSEKIDGLESLLMSGVGAMVLPGRQSWIDRAKNTVEKLPSVDNPMAGLPLVPVIDVTTGRIAFVGNEAFKGRDPYGLTEIFSPAPAFSSRIYDIAHRSEGGATSAEVKSLICGMVGTYADELGKAGSEWAGSRVGGFVGEGLGGPVGLVVGASLGGKGGKYIGKGVGKLLAGGTVYVCVQAWTRIEEYQADQARQAEEERQAREDMQADIDARATKPDVLAPADSAGAGDIPIPSEGDPQVALTSPDQTGFGNDGVLLHDLIRTIYAREVGRIRPVNPQGDGTLRRDPLQDPVRRPDHNAGVIDPAEDAGGINQIDGALQVDDIYRDLPLPPGVDTVGLALASSPANNSNVAIGEIAGSESVFTLTVNGAPAFGLSGYVGTRRKVDANLLSRALRRLANAIDFR